MVLAAVTIVVPAIMLAAPPTMVTTLPIISAASTIVTNSVKTVTAPPTASRIDTFANNSHSHPTMITGPIHGHSTP